MKIKVVTVGDGDVGKTQLVITLVHQIDHFCEQYIPTIFDTTSSLTTLAQQESYTEPIQRTSFREFQHTFEPKAMNHQRKKSPSRAQQSQKRAKHYGIVQRNGRQNYLFH
jgi:GTPase SAR1 family protein